MRAHAGRWSPDNATEGNYSALLEFAGGVTATLIYDGYGYFDDRELIEGDIFGGDQPSGPGQRLRQARAQGKLNKDTSRSGEAFEIERGDAGDAVKKPRQPFFGLTLVSCERGAIRQSAEGVFIYDEHGRTEISCATWDGPLKVELEDFYKAVNEDLPGGARRPVGQSDPRSLSWDHPIEPRRDARLFSRIRCRVLINRAPQTFADS